MKRRLTRSRSALSMLVLAFSAACSGNDVTSEPVGNAQSALEGGVPPVLLNEIKVNPDTGTDAPYEYVELRGAPDQSLANVYFVSVEGDFESVDGGSAPTGKADLLVSLGTACNAQACKIGSNGLVLIGAESGYTPPAATTHVIDARFASSSQLENNSNSFLVVYSPTPLSEGTDYDANDDGTLELPAGALLLDGIAWLDGDSGDIAYGDVTLWSAKSPPDAATRLLSNTAANTDAAWVFADMMNGEGNAGLTYATSTRLPDGGSLTPGAPNFDLVTDAGPGSDASDGGTVPSDAGSDGTAGTGGTGVTDGGTGGSAGTGVFDGGTGGSAGTGVFDGGTGGSGATGGTTDAGTGGSGGYPDAAATGGTGGTNGDAAVGSGGSAGTSGSAGSAGSAGSGGSAGSAGSAGKGGAAGSAGKAGSSSGGSSSDDDDGCSCSTPRSGQTPTGMFALLGALALFGWRRKRPAAR